MVFRPFNVGVQVVHDGPSRLGNTNTGSTKGSTKCRTGGALAWSDAVAHEDAALADSAQSTQVEPGQTTMVGARAHIAYHVHKRGLHSFTSQLNLSTFYETGGVRSGWVARVKRGCRVCRVSLCVRHASS